MEDTSYFYRIAHGPWTRLRVHMNDVPFYRRDPQEYAITFTDGANHLLVPGENALTLEILEAPPHVTVIVEITIDNNHESPVLRIDWPMMEEAVPEARALPFTITARFTARGTSYRPAYLDAPPSHFWPEGTPEQHEVVRDFHAVMARGDTSGFVEAVGLKSEEYLRAYGGDPTCGKEAAREEAAEAFAKGVEVRPLRMDDLVFEQRADGRVAYVTRRDGGKAVEAVAGDGQRFATDLWLTRHNGAWRIFR